MTPGRRDYSWIIYVSGLLLVADGIGVGTAAGEEASVMMLCSVIVVDVMMKGVKCERSNKDKDRDARRSVSRVFTGVTN